jgi:hypothetical protein
LKRCKLPSESSVWAMLAFSNGKRDLKKAETQLMTICGLANRRQAKLTNVLCECENWSEKIGALCRGWSVLWKLPGHTDARFEHATCCCKICSANSHRRTEGLALVCGNKLLQEAESDENVMGKSSRATRRGSTGMTRRRNVSLRSGSLLIPQGQRKPARCGQ